MGVEEVRDYFEKNGLPYEIREMETSTETVEMAAKTLGVEPALIAKTLAFKLERTPLAGYFDRVVCSHDIGVPKEHADFWPRFHNQAPFDPERTLFVDDSLSVLRAARAYGFRWLVAVIRPDSTQPPKSVDEFPTIDDFSVLVPGLSRHGRS